MLLLERSAISLKSNFLQFKLVLCGATWLVLWKACFLLFCRIFILCL